jgi:thioester reductase-like protein
VVALGHLPLTPNGKIDHAALPTPTTTPGTSATPPTPPRDQTEAAILDCFRRILRKPAFGMTDDFFDSGGNSLRAVRLVAEIERQFGVALNLRELFRAPTPARAVALMRGADDPAPGAAGHQGPGPGSAWSRDGELPADITPAAPHPLAWNPAHVLLTGATGFLGHALLERLLASPAVVVSCLVRAPDDAAAKVRLRQAAARFGLQLDGRVTAIAGDLAAERFGLAPERYAALASDVSAIYHCAAEVSFALPYSALRATNVAGTVEVIRFAAAQAAKALHYVSTLGTAAGQRAVRERLESAADAASSGYVSSKRVAEALVAEAGRRGLPATILRPWLVTAHWRTGAMGMHDQLALGLRAALRTATLPDVPGLPIHVMPADEVADAIVSMSGRPAAAGQVIHLYNPRLARLGEVAELLDRLGYPTRWAPVRYWAEEIERSGLDADSTLLARLFAESPARSLPSIEAQAAESLLGRPLEFSGLDAAYLGRAVNYVCNPY